MIHPTNPNPNPSDYELVVALREIMSDYGVPRQAPDSPPARWRGVPVVDPRIAEWEADRYRYWALEAFLKTTRWGDDDISARVKLVTNCLQEIPIPEEAEAYAQCVCAACGGGMLGDVVGTTDHEGACDVGEYDPTRCRGCGSLDHSDDFCHICQMVHENPDEIGCVL